MCVHIYIYLIYHLSFYTFPSIIYYLLLFSCLLQVLCHIEPIIGFSKINLIRVLAPTYSWAGFCGSWNSWNWKSTFQTNSSAYPTSSIACEIKDAVSPAKRDKIPSSRPQDGTQKHNENIWNMNMKGRWGQVKGFCQDKLPSTTPEQCECDNATGETVLRMGWYRVTCGIHAGTRIAASKMNALQHCSAMDAQHMQSRQWIQTDRSDLKKHMIYSTLYIICKWYHCKQQKCLQKVFQKLNISGTMPVSSQYLCLSNLLSSWLHVQTDCHELSWQQRLPQGLCPCLRQRHSHPEQPAMKKHFWSSRPGRSWWCF